MTRTTWTGLAIAALSVAAAVLLYDRLPAAIPVHWDIHGRVDGEIAKPWGVFVYPIAISVLALLATVLPAISPWGFRIERFARAFQLIVMATIVFIAALMAFVFAPAIGISIATGRAVPAAAGVLLIVIGNVMGKVTHNFFVGVRTPWTLASDEVWSRTNRLTGRLLVLSGIALTVTAVLGIDLLVPLVGILAVIAIVPIGYSYLLYRRLEHPHLE
jgi:uncharacterized membrane protein